MITFITRVKETLFYKWSKLLYEWLYQYITCGLIFRGFHALDVEFFQLNLLHLRPGCHYTPVRCHGMPKTSHGGLAYGLLRALRLIGYLSINQVIFCSISKDNCKRALQGDCGSGTESERTISLRSKVSSYEPLTAVGSCRIFFRRQGLILSEVFWYMERSNNLQKRFITVRKRSLSWEGLIVKTRLF